MSAVARSFAILIAASACSGSTPSTPGGPRDAPLPLPAVDAAADGTTAIGTFDPASGLHHEDDGPLAAGAAQPQIGTVLPRTKGRPPRPIDVILRSSPSGARAAVDGTPIGTTPTYWSGDADGREHEFTFVLAKHAVARYRFVPITSGVVHARLDPIADDHPAANLEPLIAPRLAPDAGIAIPAASPRATPAPTATSVPTPPTPAPVTPVPVPSPATVLTPDAAADVSNDAATPPAATGPTRAPAGTDAGPAATSDHAPF